MIDRCAVVDTSCAISYYLGSKSVDRLAMDHLRIAHHLLASEETLSEFREVILRTKFDRIPRNVRLAFAENYRSLVHLVDPGITITACIDPKDDKFLSLAVSAKAALFLTNDNHLLQLDPFRGIDILSPKTYLERTGTTTPR